MQTRKILFLNFGYARGISGGLTDHIRYVHRHFYCPPAVQLTSLQKLSNLITEEKPDIACIVEIEGNRSATKNQIHALTNSTYPFFDIENKYGRDSVLRTLPFTAGKSNAFLARKTYPFEKIFFNAGRKRLIYRIQIDENTTLFFAHFSLKQSVRARQLLEARELMRKETGEVIFLGDFNILSGLGEIAPLLDGGRFVLLNKSDVPTFFFHNRSHTLDLCICTRPTAEKATLRILPQAYTDHAALILQTHI